MGWRALNAKLRTMGSCRVSDFVLLGILERWLWLQGGDELKRLR